MNNFILIALILIFIWVGILTVFLRRTIRHYQTLTEGIDKKNLSFVLEKILKDLAKGEEQRESLARAIEKLTKENIYNIQKVGLVRYNPFAETGGNQSFCLALLDGEDSGLVISSLHSRETTRIYAKPVKKGKSLLGYQLSAEEEEAIKNAKKNRGK